MADRRDGRQAATSSNPEAGLSGTLTAAFSVSGGGAPEAATVDPTRVAADPPFGIDAFDTATAEESGAAATAAGSHPFANLTNFDLNTHTEPKGILRGFAWPVEPVRDAGADLPPGLLGNPSGMGRCTASQLANASGLFPKPECPARSQVGTVLVRDKGFPAEINYGPLPLFNLTPPPGAPASFGFNFAGTLVTLDAHLRSGADGYFVSVEGAGISQALAVIGNRIEFWGDPAAPAHDEERACPGEKAPFQDGPAAPAGCPGAYSRPEHQAFLRNPTACTAPGEGLTTSFHVDSWAHLGARTETGAPELSDPAWKSASATSHEAPGYPLSPGPSAFNPAYSGPTEWGPVVGIEGCGAEPFSPSFSAIPTTPEAGSPTGLEVSISMPQHGLTEPEGTAESDLRSARVTLPEGMSLNPSSAGGLGACSEAQIGYEPGTSGPFEFDQSPQSCPDSAKIGTVELESPLLARYDGSGNPVADSEGRPVPEVLHGAVYLARQQENPFGSLLAIYLVVEDERSGVTLKLPGKIEADPASGRLTTTFDENPQLPFEHLRLELAGGPRAPLINPPACGTYSSHATLTGWSGEVVEEASPFTLAKGPAGGPCPAGSFAPKLEAGTRNPIAGAFSPFSLRLSREDGEGLLGGLTAKLPEGLLGSLRGIAYCPEATLAAISSEPGSGQAQIDSPSCPASSQVGTVTVGAGAGPTPFYTQSPRAYLAGPYKGAPLSLAVVAPAVAGPFDLGSVVVRNALQIDPETTRITAVSDPLPTILHGIPLDLRDVRVDLDRPGFTLNPTSCEPMQISSTVTSPGGRSASPSVRFQVSGCQSLPFAPKISLRLKGKTKRTGHPALTATLTAAAGNEANVAHASVALPHSEFLDQAHIKTICTRVQYAAGGGGGEQCPPKSVYGHAFAVTPLLDKPLEGNVYLRSSDHALPDLVVSLGGQIHVDLDGRIDTVNGGIRATFETVPDAFVQKFVLTMQGGKKGLLQNSTDLCAGGHRAGVDLEAHNGKVEESRPVLKAAGCKGRGRGKKTPAKHHRGAHR